MELVQFSMFMTMNTYQKRTNIKYLTPNTVRSRLLG